MSAKPKSSSRSNAFSLCKAACFVVAEGIIDEAPRDEEVNGRLIATVAQAGPGKLHRLT